MAARASIANTKDIYMRYKTGHIDSVEAAEHLVALQLTLPKMSLITKIIQDLDLLDKAVHTAYFKSLLEFARNSYMWQMTNFDHDPREYSLRDYVEQVIATSTKAKQEVDDLPEDEKKRFWLLVAKLQDHLES